MKTKLTFIIATLAAIAFSLPALADVKIDAQLRIGSHPREDLEVYVWPDRGMDGVYYPGELINVNVEVTRDAFLILYNIDTQGRLQILFPSSPYDDNFVRSGDVISFPRRSDDMDWTVDGPSGTEYIEAIASEIPISLPEWPIYLTDVNMPDNVYPDAALRDFHSGNDRYAYIDVVNHSISGRYYDWCATDVATFVVHPTPRTYHVYDNDPWPEVFYGDVYIGWPVGATIYVDNVYIGVAPCWVPRHYYGRHVITCFDGLRLIRTNEVRCYPKRDYFAHNQYRGPREIVWRRGRSDANDHFRYEKNSVGRSKYRVYDRDGSKDYRSDGERYKSAPSKESDRDNRVNGESVNREKPSKRGGEVSVGTSNVIRQERGSDKVVMKSSRTQVKTTDKRDGNSTQVRSEKVTKRDGAASVGTSNVIRQERGTDKVAVKSPGRQVKNDTKRDDNSAQADRVTVSKRSVKTSVEKSAVIRQGGKTKVEMNSKTRETEKSQKSTKRSKGRG